MEGAARAWYGRLTMPEQGDFLGGAGRKMGTGHRGSPGAGPAGETCNTCDHVRVQPGTQKRYYKCGIGNVTRGPGTDIRLKDAACEFWKEETNDG